MAGSCGGGCGGGFRVPEETVLLGKREEPLDTDSVPAGGQREESKIQRRLLF